LTQVNSSANSYGYDGKGGATSGAKAATIRSICCGPRCSASRWWRSLRAGRSTGPSSPPAPISRWHCSRRTAPSTLDTRQSPRHRLQAHQGGHLC